MPNVKRVMLFDYDNKENAFHPPAENKTLVEWQRKNIENYLLVPEAWKRAAASALQLPEDGLFAQPAMQTIDDFFGSQNLSRPPKSKNWRSVSADIFGEVNGKRILFEAELSLFQQLQKSDPSAKMIRESVARAMTADEIHEDVHQFFAKLISLVEPKTPDTA